MNCFNETVSPNIKRILKEQGIKQYVIAEKSKIPFKKFSDMLNGRAIMKADDLPQIAKALGVTVNELFKRPESS